MAFRWLMCLHLGALHDELDVGAFRELSITSCATYFLHVKTFASVAFGPLCAQRRALAERRLCLREVPAVGAATLAAGVLSQISMSTTGSSTAVPSTAPSRRKDTTAPTL